MLMENDNYWNSGPHTAATIYGEATATIYSAVCISYVYNCT